MYNLNASGERSFAVGVTCLTIATAAVGLRFACKLVVKGGLHIDDLWIVIGLLSYGGAGAVAMWGLISGGGGAEMKDLIIAVAEAPGPATLSKLSNFLESLWLSFALYLFTAFAIKMSILFFYRRIFTTAAYKTVSLGVMVFAALWFVSSEMTYLLLCRPIHSFWDRLKPGKCLNFNDFFLATGIIEIICDSLILILPVRMVFDLQMPMRTKAVLASIFLLGGFVIVTGIIRLRYVYQPHSEYVNFAPAEFWTHIHLATALLCACTPIYKPLWGKFSDLSTSFFSKYGSAFRSLLGGTSSGGSKSGGVSTTGKSSPSYLHMSSVDERKGTAGSANGDDSDAYSDTSRKLLPIYGRSDRTVKIEGGNWPGYHASQNLGVKPQGIVYSRQVEVV